MKLIEEQRAAAFYGENAVIAAGAGSGKTMVLANRFAWLVTEKGLKVNEILTLTFTIKAAAQMYRRIHSLLAEIADEGERIKAQRARQALDDFIHARIQTLDSYSAAIVRQSASRYGISPDFSIDQDRCHDLALDVSLPFLIAHRHHPAIERLYSAKRPNDIVNSIFANVLFNNTRIEKERDLSGDIKKQFDIVCAEWNNQCGDLSGILKETEKLIFDNEALLPDLVPIMGGFREGEIHIPDTGEIRAYFDLLLESARETSLQNAEHSSAGETCIEKAEAHPFQNSVIKLLEFLASFDGLNLRRGVKSDNQAKERVKQIRALFGKFSSLAVFCLQAGFVISLMSLLGEMQRRYLNRKRAEKVLTFADVANLARTVLLEQEDIRQSEKESFRAIMIDEFQDNNELQKDLLFLLAEKTELMTRGIPRAEDLSRGKLFFVGDEKQSIYLFRGADVSVFRKLKNELKSADLPLTSNFRSAVQLIVAFNAIFGGGDFDPQGKTPMAEKRLNEVQPSVFAPGEDLPLYEASYTPLKAVKTDSGKLSLCILNKNDSSRNEENAPAAEFEARFVAERISRLLEEKNGTGEPKYRPDDIAILFRSRSPQHLFEKHLRLLDIRYSSEDLNDFFYGGIVNDIMSVLRLAAYPADSAAYAEMLRSPFAGISMSGLAQCLAVFQKSEKHEPFDDRPLSFLDACDRDKYKNGQKVYARIREKAATESVSSLVSELWYNLGYRYEAEWNPQTSVYRELYDYLFHLAVKADDAGNGLAAFTDSIIALRDAGERLSEIEIPLERSGAVHLLTIHKSKGLEFPVVFICGCGRHSQTSTAGDVFFSDDTGIAFSLPLPRSCSHIDGIRRNFFWDLSNAEARRKRTAELRRLLYVGMTRAENELYLTGCLNIGEAVASAMPGFPPDDKDDFSARLKNYIDKKTGCNDNFIAGDSIIDNDTFFGLCLPAIVSHIPVDGLSKEAAFFNIEEIPFYSGDYIMTQRTAELRSASITNDQNGLNAFFEKAGPFYKSAEVIETPLLRDNHLTPTSLRGKDDITEENIQGGNISINRGFSGEESGDVFKKVDTLLARFTESGDDSKGGFNSGSFGTIAHICAEALMNGEEPQLPSGITGFLTPGETEAFLDAGKELALRFTRSPLGKIAGSAQLRESEFSFRSLIRVQEGKEYFIGGTVDLLFEDKDSVHIVDFKTDSREMPAEHIAQIACYYRAVYSLFAEPVKKECRCWLYYLRTGHVVEITQKAKLFDLESRVGTASSTPSRGVDEKPQTFRRK